MACGVMQVCLGFLPLSLSSLPIDPDESFLFQDDES